MIRLVYCVACRQDVDLAAFRKYWEKEHVALVDRCAEVLKPRKYTQAATLLVERNWRIMEMRGTGKPFDGMLEFWWDDAADYESVAGTRPAREAIDELFTDEKRFIDHAHSRAFFTEEFRIVECCPYRPGPRRPGSPDSPAQGPVGPCGAEDPARIDDEGRVAVRPCPPARSVGDVYWMVYTSQVKVDNGYTWTHSNHPIRMACAWCETT